MRCREAKLLLAAQRDSELAQSDSSALQKHLEHCSACRAYQWHLQGMDVLFRATPIPPMYVSISTDRIMQAVRRQQQITQQLEDLRSQQRSRIARMLPVGPSLAALTFFIIGSIPLLLLAITIVQPDVLVRGLMLLGDVADTFVMIAQYLQTGATLVTHDNWLLSGIAVVLIVMAGTWLRLMRSPQEA